MVLYFIHLEQQEKSQALFKVCSKENSELLFGFLFSGEEEIHLYYYFGVSLIFCVSQK